MNIKVKGILIFHLIDIMLEENSSPDSDPLQQLYVDKNKINRKLLSEILVDYIGIDKDSLNPVFKSAYQDLKEKQKILVYLLYRRALVVLGHIQKEEVGQSPKKIAEATGINYNSVRGYLSQLSPLLEKREDKGGYYILPYSLSAVEKKLNQS